MKPPAAATITDPVLVIGAGPAGLTTAYELVRHGVPVAVMEKSDQVGGISRTEVRGEYRFDIGGHRFFTKVDEVNRLWREVLGDAFIRVRRLSRIFYGGKFYAYPLSAFDTVRNLGVVESARILFSYLQAKVRPLPREDTFEQWVVNRFGRRLFNTFFKTYTEKVWGIPCDQIDSAWAAQRIQGLSLKSAVVNALFGGGNAKTLINEFDYPRFGPGQMWERFREVVTGRGARVSTQADVSAIHHDGAGRVIAASVVHQGVRRRLDVSHVVSSMALPTLLRRLDPPPPAHVLEAAAKLTYRDFILVGSFVRRDELFPDNWIYIHSPGVRVGRIQNFKNWSPHMVPAAGGMTSLGMEYFCTRGDDLWELSDDQLVELARRELAELGLADLADVEVGGVVIRQPKAYPVYDRSCASHLKVLREYLERFSNLQTIGRNGMHRYNNQDHSMLTGLLAARNVLGERHDLWSVNTERSYHEQFDGTRAAESASGATPAVSPSPLPPASPLAPLRSPAVPEPDYA